MEVGTQVWIELSSGWQRGTIESKSGDSFLAKVGDEAIRISLDGNKIPIEFAGSPDSTGGHVDLSSLEHANVPSMLEVLSVRYAAMKIYTFAGDTLLSVNPFANTDLYSTDIMKHYASDFRVAHYGADPAAQVKDPHVYLTSINALKRMFGSVDLIMHCF